MSHKVKKLLHKQQVRERQSGSHLFKSVDLKNSQNFERQFSPEERKNIVKTTIKDQLRYQNSTLTKQMHFIEKASAMKSQLQLGLRKLSYKVDQDRTKDQLRQRRDQPRKSSMKRVKKSHQSQVSFVGLCCEDGCFSSQSSCKYKDCFSSQKYKSVRKPEEKSREREIFSSGSSKYYLANDGDSESLCSCCQNEFIHQSRNMTSHPSQRSLKTQQIPRRQSGRLPKLQVENSVLVSKSSKLVNQKSHQKHQSSKKLREGEDKRQSQGKQKSHHKSNKKQSKERSQDKVRMSNKLSQQQWQIPQQMIQQMKLRQSLDNIQQIWPSLNPTLQYQISQQLQNQPQIYPNGFQQQNFSVFMPSQPMLMPGILNQSQTINQLPCPLLLDNPLALPLQKQFSLQANQMALESQREQIEAIENLIKIAKSKLESTQDDEDECKYRKTRNNKGLSNRKENVYNTYDQSSRQEFNDAEYFSKGSVQSTKNRDSQNFKDRRRSDAIEERSESKQELLKKQTSPKIMSQLDRLQSQIKKHISQSELSNRWDERPSIGNNKLNRIQEERSNERDPQALKTKDIKPYKAQRIDLTEDFSLKVKKVGQFNDDHTALNTTDQSKAQIFDDNQSIQNQPLKVDLTNQVQAFLPNQIKKSKTQKPNTWKMEFSVNDENQDGPQTTVNLADAFKKKLADQFEEKMNQRVAKVKEIKEKKDFTKQELLERKKELLKQARTQLQSRQQSQHPQLDEEKATNIDNPLANTKIVKVDISQQRDSKEPLMSRLSTGQRPEISRKDMLKLTNKNYELLPEIQRKKYEESKKEDLKKRVAMVKDMEKKRRETVVKKRNEINKFISRTQTAKTQDELKD